MFDSTDIEILGADGDGVRRGEVIARIVSTGKNLFAQTDGTVEFSRTPRNFFLDVAAKDGETYLNLVAFIA